MVWHGMVQFSSAAGVVWRGGPIWRGLAGNVACMAWRLACMVQCGVSWHGMVHVLAWCGMA